MCFLNYKLGFISEPCQHCDRWPNGGPASEAFLAAASQGERVSLKESARDCWIPQETSKVHNNIYCKP